VEAGQPLAMIHAKDTASAEAAAKALAAHIHIAAEAPKKSSAILETIE
jgi:thymidine phosphorylase